MPVKSPKLWRISATKATFTPDADCTWLEWEMCAAGGGGMGTDTAATPPGNYWNWYGKRGGDSYFMMKPSENRMFACAPDGVVVYFPAPHNLYPDEVLFLENIPVGCSLLPDMPYYAMPITPTTAKICDYPLSPPYSPPWGAPHVQTPLIVTPTGVNPVITIRRFWYGVQGGGGGGIIGDQGTPVGYWGCDANGPDGYKQSEGFQGGCGDASFKMGGRGGASGYGGNSGNTFMDFGIAGTNLCGAGGGGAAPAAGVDWGGTGGAAGARARGKMLNPGIPILCIAGIGGLGGLKTGTGYDGGPGGHGSLSIWQHYS